MKKTLNCFMLIATCAIFASVYSSCKENKDDDITRLYSLSVRIVSEKKIDDYTLFSVKIADLKSGQEWVKKCGDSGEAMFDLPSGNYDIEVEDLVDGCSTMYGVERNFTLDATNSQLTIEVQKLSKLLDKTFVLDELYFNGATNPPFNMTFYETYFSIRNISNRPLYADGLSFAITADFNVIPEAGEMQNYLPDSIVVSQMYTIPGNGRTYKVEPNESLVIAHSAINHKERKEGEPEKPKSIDLSGADFEIFVPHEYVMTVDNPEVPNVIVDFSTFEAFHWQSSGSTPLFIFRLDDDVREGYVEKHKKIFNNPMSISVRKQYYLVLPTSAIIDGVETGVDDYLNRKVLPIAVDKSAFTVPGDGYKGFEEHFIRRKEVLGEDGKMWAIDNNDSANDYQLLTGGQKSYPAKK